MVDTIYKRYHGTDTYWCNSHKRKADYIRDRLFADGSTEITHCCDPHQGGNMLPCSVVNLDNLGVKLEDE